MQSFSAALQVVLLVVSQIVASQDNSATLIGWQLSQRSHESMWLAVVREVCSVLVKAAVRREVIHDQLQKFLSNCHVVQCHIQYLCVTSRNMSFCWLSVILVGFPTLPRSPAEPLLMSSTKFAWREDALVQNWSLFATFCQVRIFVRKILQTAARHLCDWCRRHPAASDVTCCDWHDPSPCQLLLTLILCPNYN